MCERDKIYDVSFTGAYAAAYSVDTQPCQQLNLNNGTASVQCINLIQQGTGLSQRIGNEVFIKKALIRLVLSATGNALAYQSYGRILLIYDKQPNGAYMSTANMLSQLNQDNSISTGNFLSNLNPYWFERFDILWDELLVNPPVVAGDIATASTTSATEHEEYVFEKEINLGVNTIYTGSSNPMVIANIVSGALLLATLGSSAAGVDDPWCLNGYVRICFEE